MSLIPNIKTKNKQNNSNILTPACPPTDNLSVAEVAMIGNFPSNKECLEREPFIGQAGKQLNRICAAAQLPRYKIYLTNACKNNVKNKNKLWTEKGWKCPEWNILQDNLINELRDFKGNIIIPLGATATMMLLGKNEFSSISKYRGSVYSTNDFPHLRNKIPNKFILPTYHPSFSLPQSNPKSFYIILFDILKALRVSENPKLLENNIKLIIRPNFTQVMEFFSLIKTKDIVAFDIEATPFFITCFSFAIKDTDKITSICIPLLNNNRNYWPIDQEVIIWEQTAEILADKNIRKICQNGMFDLMYMLRKMNITTENFYFDTMLAQHLVYTDLPKGLDFLTSVYTYFPFYKDDGKKSHLKLIKEWQSYWEYNAKDSAYLFQIMDALMEELEEFNCLDSMQYQMELHKPLIEMEYNGILTDKEGILKYRKYLEKQINALQSGLNKITGRELNINSAPQLISYFYGELMIKPYINPKTKNATCNTVALHRIAKKGKKGSVEAKFIIKMRKYGKLLTTYFTVNTDTDNKLRCNYSISGTVSGRIATRATYFETPTGEKIGTNLQNQPYAYKKYLMADPDYYLIEFDLAKAEAHVVAYLCQDSNMIESFESGVDVHSFNASKIFNIPIEEVIAEAKSGLLEQRKTKRYMGKKVVHASNYKMGPGTFSDQLAVEDIYISQSECKKLLQAYQDRFPGLTRWHTEIDNEIMENRVLYNLFGRPKRFLGMFSPALFRNGYSYIPQSTVAELLNRGLIKMANDPRLGRDLYDIDFLTTVHDSGVIQVHKKQLPNLLNILLIIRDHLTHTFTYLGRSFTIGLDATIGKRWKGNTAEINSFDQQSIDKALEKIGA